MKKPQSFREFCNKHCVIYRIFGVVPINSQSVLSSKCQVSILFIIAVCTFLGIYGTGVVFTFLVDEHLNDKISVISNWIQILTSSATVFAAILCPLFKRKEFLDMISQFENIDRSLTALGHSIQYGDQLRKSNVITAVYLAILFAVIGFDFYVTIDLYQMTATWYWLVSIVPLFVYSMGLINAMFMIYWIKLRCSLVNETLEKYRTSETAEKLSSGPVHLSIVHVLPPHNEERHDSKIEHRSNETPERSDEQMSVLARLFSIMNDLCKLSRQIDQFYGLAFLMTIGTLFAVTSIQVYYCYIVIINMGRDINCTVWTLIVSLNIVAVNLSLVIGIGTVCESVSDEAAKIIHNFSALQINKKVPILNELSIWVHPMLSYIKFTAYSFFSIDYNMLCGFMTALITYLVIFIQFNALNDHQDGQVYRVRKNDRE